MAKANIKKTEKQDQNYHSMKAYNFRDQQNYNLTFNPKSNYKKYVPLNVNICKARFYFIENSF